MPRTTTTYQLFDIESTLLQDVTDEQAQSVSGGFSSSVLPFTISSITSLPPSQPSPATIGGATQNQGVTIPLVKGGATQNQGVTIPLVKGI